MSSLIDRHPEGFIVCPRNDDGIELGVANPNAFLLLYIVAMRAWRTRSFNRHGLEPGEALIGDWKRCGLTRQQYRTALHFLTTRGFLTIKTTNRGTVAQLITTRVFDINLDEANHQNNHRPTTAQPLTRSKEGKNGTKKTRTTAMRRFLPVSKPSSVAEVENLGVRLGYDRELILRFIRYNNAQGWRVKSWKAALRGFVQKCNEDCPGGMGEVPPGWIPKIE